MTEGKTLPIDVIAFRADDYSPDSKNIIISLTTKFSNAESKIFCPHLIVFTTSLPDVRRLNAIADWHKGRNRASRDFTANDTERTSGQAVLLWKKKRARTGRARGQRERPLKKPNRACDSLEINRLS